MSKKFCEYKITFYKIKNKKLNQIKLKSKKNKSDRFSYGQNTRIKFLVNQIFQDQIELWLFS